MPIIRTIEPLVAFCPDPPAGASPDAEERLPVSFSAILSGKRSRQNQRAVIKIFSFQLYIFLKSSGASLPLGSYPFSHIISGGAI